MRGSLRVIVLLFSALRVQQWLLCASALLIVIGYLAPRGIGPVFVALGFIFTIAPLLFAGGLMLRYFISPRAMQLVPRARQQVLGGMALTVVLITSAITLAFWSFGFPTERLPVVSLRVATLASLLLLSQFRLVTSVPGMMVWFGLIALGVPFSQISAARPLFAAVANSELQMGLMLVTVWAAFGAWFLRAPALKSPNEVAVHGTRVVSVKVSQGAAIRAFLFGNPSVRALFSGGFLTVVLACLTWTLLALSTGAVDSFAEVLQKFVGPVFAFGAYAGIGGFVVVRRSRFLWLRGGIDRNGLFRLCEAQAWRFFGATAASLVLLLAFDWVVTPEHTATALILLLLELSIAACLLYLGLMHVRGWRVLDVICTIVLAGTWILSFPILVAVMDRRSLLPVALGAIVAFAIVLRLIAAHRWRRIDWLVCKPTKLTPRGLPAAS